MKLAIIGCSKTKFDKTCEAQYLYNSVLFRKTLIYCLRHLEYKEIVILSAKYGILDCNDIITNYNETIKEKSKLELEFWKNRVINSIFKLNIKNIDFYCGQSYIKPLNQSLLQNNFIINEPLKGLGIGQRIKYLTIKE